MRLRSLATVSATTFLLAAAAIRCSVPPLPPGPEPIRTDVGIAGGAFVAVPPGAAVDRAALIASLKEMSFSAVIIQASADATGESVQDRVALAVELEAALGANVFVGGYQARALDGKPMDALLQPDATFATCYPGGPALDAAATLVDKLRICSQDIGKKIADELARVSASPRIGCYISHQPQLTDSLAGTALTKLHDLLTEASSACIGAKRIVGVSPILGAQPGVPIVAANLLRSAIEGTGIGLVILDDGVGRFEPTRTRRASAYYDALVVAPGDGGAPVSIWANIEAFDCAGDAGCDRTRPTDNLRFDDQVCGARFRVHGIIANEYLHHLAGRPLLTGDFDASTDASGSAATELRAILDDTDAAAQLRSGYLAWLDAGASCSAAAADEADAKAQAAPAPDAQ